MSDVIEESVNVEKMLWPSGINNYPEITKDFSFM